MKMRTFAAFALVVVIVFTPTLAMADSEEAATCTFELGFKTLHDMIPSIVGQCLVNVHYNPQNGDGLQETTNGLMVWRKADNFTAFTDGHRTWINGPYGLQVRLNTERFPWETDYIIQQAVNLVASKGYTVFNTSTFNPGAILNVLIGTLTGSADGYNQLAFFFHSGNYLGTDTANPSAQVSVAWQTNDTVSLDYVLYRPNDPMCCPTGGGAHVRYFFDGTSLKPLDPIPSDNWDAPLSRR
ncbi:MAG: LppP/LprE family lipoprotein [Chloroflexi bacterium]|nr:LppP/LprE family lipoprotein [Chloroflexota bacterium]